MSTGKADRSSTVKFGNPPPPRERAPYDWQKIAAKLRKKPGEWALIFEADKTTYASAIRISGIQYLRPADGFEVRTTNNVRPAGEPRICDLWLRYNPDTDRSNT